MRLADAGGYAGGLFKTMEKLEASQKTHELRGKSEGPADLQYYDCSMTAARLSGLADPPVGANTWGVYAMDSAIQQAGLSSTDAAGLGIGDIVRQAKDGAPTHFSNFIFRDDNGAPIVFSRSGENGAFQIRSIKSLEALPLYGPVAGIGKKETGFYTRP